MRKWFKILLWVVGSAFLILTIVYFAVASYVSTHRNKFLAEVISELNEHFEGTLSIESADPSFFRNFPSISVRLNQVVLKDRQWRVHHQTPLSARQLLLSINMTGFLRGRVQINEIEIKDARLNLFVDSGGYSNWSVFKHTEEKGVGSEESAESGLEIGKVNFSNVSFLLNDQFKHKDIDLLFDQLSGKIKYSSSGWNAQIQVRAAVNNLVLNMRRGSFIKGKQVTGALRINFYKPGIFDIAAKKLNIGGDIFHISGEFNSSRERTNLLLKIQAPSILWNHASALLTKNISSRLNKFSLEKPINVNCTIKSDLRGGSDPSIEVKTIIKNNVLHTPGGIVNDCSFSGFFSNRISPLRKSDDDNSAIKILNFKGSYERISFKVDSLLISNFVRPFASGNIRSEFPLTLLNKIVGKELLVFQKGTADINLHYNAPIGDFKIQKPRITGSVRLRNGDITYVPRHVVLKNTGVFIDFTPNDLFIKEVRMQSGKSNIFMDGSIRNFSALLYENPEKMAVNWNVTSPELHLEDFIGFLEAKKTKRSKKTGEHAFSQNLANIFEKSLVNLNLKVRKIYYNNFVATSADAIIRLSEDHILVDQLKLKHAGGSMSLKGHVVQNGSKNNFAMKGLVQKVNIKDFFHAFNNFGLTSLTSENLEGHLLFNCNLSGQIGNNGNIVSNSLSGDMTFELANGVLTNFDPIKNIGKFAFPFRDLDRVTFGKLTGRFDVKGEKIAIHPMQINSSLINMDLEGIYSLDAGTRIVMSVPLRNPEKDRVLADPEKIKERRMKGIVLHLLAEDGEDGKVKIKLVSKRSLAKQNNQ